jgi:uncharacterized SAM-binding protein YcdF (DUF218 family)
VRHQKKQKTAKRFLGKRLKLTLLSLIALSLWFGYKQIEHYWIEPEAVFVLGGHEDRERFAAQLAKEHPNLQIWVSSGSPEDYVEKIFKNRGIASDRIHLDYQAIDTVTNFTTLVDDLEARGIKSVYLVTSDSHMRRAIVISEIVFGSRGITVKPIAVPSNSPPEPVEKSLRDGARAIIWLITGYTGSKSVISKQSQLIAVSY